MQIDRARSRAALAAVLLALAAGVATCAALGAVAPPPAAAWTLGVGDQSPRLFGDPTFQRLGVQRVRYIAAYDVALRPGPRAAAADWLGAARLAGKEVVVAFNPPVGMSCPNLDGARGCRPVPVARYRRAFKAFRQRWPWVRIVQPWNEVNSITQPTAGHPEKVVAYYRVVRRLCRGCTVLGADLQDLPDVAVSARRLLRAFRAARVPLPRLWGVHNYSDTNRFLPVRRSGLRKLVRLLPGKLWLTETGGIYRFRPQRARQSFRPDADRQRRALEAVLRSAQRWRRKVTRVYLYHWFGAPATNRWDSGIFDPGGAPRPALEVLERNEARFR